MSDLVTLLLTPDALAEMKAAEGEVESLAALSGLETDEHVFGVVLGHCQSRLARIEEVRLSIAKPMTEAKRAIDALFSKAAEPYEKAKDLIKARLSALATERYRAQEAAKQAHALALAQMNVITPGEYAAEVDPVFAITAPVPLPAAAIPNTTQTMEWTWTLDDITLVPERFLALNHATMKGYANEYRKSSTIPEIPGVTFQRVVKVGARQG